MPSETEIIAEIEKIVGTYTSYWTIGITEDPDRRKQEHGNPVLWHHWDAVLELTARNIEKYFLAKGMKGDVGGGIYPHYVYIFWK
jgi:hypothetical protein